VKVAGKWRYLYRAVDQFGQVIDVLVSPKRDKKAARRFFTWALAVATALTVVTTDRATAYPRLVKDILPGAVHVTHRYANNRVESDHGRLKARLRPMRGIKTDRSLRVVATGHAFIQNLRRGHYKFGTDATTLDRVAVAFTELALAI
jgi:transposase-like protein